MPPSLIHLPHRGLLSVSGRDAFKYLQALTTNSLAPPRSQFTSFLNAQGRILFDTFIYRTAETSCLIETDVRSLESLGEHLRRYKLRSKVEFRVLDSTEQRVYQYITPRDPPNTHQGPSNTDQGSSDTHQGSSDMPHGFGNVGGITSSISDSRALGLGHRLICAADISSSLDVQIGSVGDYVKMRYGLGVPEGPSELVMGKALPMESNVDYMAGLDFHKGCYLGQELTIRTHHTGVIRKRIVPVRLTPSEAGSATSRDHVTGTSAENGTGTSPEKDVDLEQVQWYPDEGVTCEVKKSASGGSSTTATTATGRSSGRVLGAYGNLGIALMRLSHMQEQQYTATVNGRQVSVVPYVPTHWPGQPESV